MPGSRHVERVSSAGVEVVKTLDVAPATALLLEVATQPSKESDGQVAAAAAAAAPKQCMTVLNFVVVVKAELII